MTLWTGFLHAGSRRPMMKFSYTGVTNATRPTHVRMYGYCSSDPYEGWRRPTDPAAADRYPRFKPLG
jgi:hypothetical protein